ncbi:MAG: hypothetical protein P1U81_17725 [Verrucomicrobiales bacterium]|nr:hypothetical protein [Verrucomicrobiales bacterium]
MSEHTCETHPNHNHQHGADCGHTAIRRSDHADYLHNVHLHHQSVDGVVEKHSISLTILIRTDVTSVRAHATRMGMCTEPV